MTNSQKPLTYTDYPCAEHNKDVCYECNICNIVSHKSKHLIIGLSAYDKIGKVDWVCDQHKEARFISACLLCVKEQLEKEYERGKKEAPNELRSRLAAAEAVCEMLAELTESYLVLPGTRDRALLAHWKAIRDKATKSEENKP